MERAMRIEPTSEPWGLLNVPASLPRGQTNLRPELAFWTVPDNHTREENSPPLVCVSRCVSGEREGLAHKYVACSTAQSKRFPTHNPTHRMRCLVRLTRCLAVPAVLYVVVKPNRVTL
jgi:hypothetical protein